MYCLMYFMFFLFRCIKFDEKELFPFLSKTLSIYPQDPHIPMQNVSSQSLFGEEHSESKGLSQGKEKLSI